MIIVVVIVMAPSITAVKTPMRVQIWGSFTGSIPSSAAVCSMLPGPAGNRNGARENPWRTCEGARWEEAPRRDLGSGMAHLLGAEGISLSFPTKDVFDDVTVGLDEGDRIGVVGRNGDGKSTLLRILAGRQQPDAGRVTVRGGTRIGMLDQADALPDDDDPPRRRRRPRRARVGGRREGARRHPGLLGDLPWDARMGELGRPATGRARGASAASGTWCSSTSPPTTSTSRGVAWPAEHLKGRWPKNQGGLVVVTHDRWFLDEVSTDTWEVHDGIVEPFEGATRPTCCSASSATGWRPHPRRSGRTSCELAWLRRGAPARTAKPKFRIDALNQLIENEPPVRDAVALQSLAVARLGKDVVDLLDVSVSFPDADGGERQVLRDIEWRIAPGERTGILGVNGAGKSTLLGLVAGTVAPTTGRVKQGKTVKIAVLDQRLAELDDVAHDRVSDVVAASARATRWAVPSSARGKLLERLGFRSAQLSTPVKDLSGGQKRRLQLLLILLEGPNVLILDEPTNDLDTDMLAAMEDLLDSWAGTLLVVSHDRYLIERVTDQQYAVLDGRMRVPAWAASTSTSASAPRPPCPRSSSRRSSSSPGRSGRGILVLRSSGRRSPFPR